MGGKAGEKDGAQDVTHLEPLVRFFSFFFDYTNTYIHLEVHLRDPNNGYTVVWAPVFYIYMHPSTQPRQHSHVTTPTAYGKSLTLFGPYVSFFFI